MQLKFTKMHGAGNDFVVIDLISQRLELQTRHVRKLADRRLGVGCDQVLVVEAPSRPDVDFRYRIYMPMAKRLSNVATAPAVSHALSVKKS